MFAISGGGALGPHGHTVRAALGIGTAKPVTVNRPRARKGVALSGKKHKQSGGGIQGLMIIGAHSIVYSKNAEADRKFLRAVLGLSGTDAGGGWLIFGLPPAELAVHPSDSNDVHELYFMCDDIEEFVSTLKKKNVECSPIENQRWGLLTRVSLPGGGKIGVYEPRHERPNK